MDIKNSSESSEKVIAGPYCGGETTVDKAISAALPAVSPEVWAQIGRFLSDELKGIFVVKGNALGIDDDLLKAVD